MKKLLIPMFIKAIFLYLLSELVGTAKQPTATYNGICIAILIGLYSLLIASLYSVYVHVKGEQHVEVEPKTRGNCLLNAEHIQRLRGHRLHSRFHLLRF